MTHSVKNIEGELIVKLEEVSFKYVNTLSKCQQSPSSIN